MNEVDTFEGWLWGLLRYDATLQALVGSRVYADRAPLGATLPAVVFQQQAAVDVTTGPGVARIMTNTLYLVRGVAEGGSYTPLLPVEARIDELLQGASGSPVGAQVLHCHREAPFRLVERTDGIEIRHLGGLYRCWVSAA